MSSYHIRVAIFNGEERAFAMLARAVRRAPEEITKLFNEKGVKETPEDGVLTQYIEVLLSTPQMVSLLGTAQLEHMQRVRFGAGAHRIIWIDLIRKYRADHKDIPTISDLRISRDHSLVAIAREFQGTAASEARRMVS